MKLWVLKKFFFRFYSLILSLTFITNSLAATDKPTLDKRTIDKPAIERSFHHWLEHDFWPLAKANGITRQNFEKAFKNVKINWSLPDLIIKGAEPQKKQIQAEFASPSHYFNKTKIQALVTMGKKYQTQHRQLLSKISARYHIPPTIILAIWGRETAFGTVKIPYNAIDVLATKAFMSTRQDMFKKELLSALLITQKNNVNVDTLKSSWAGALGLTQFMPSSYLKYGVDFDGDGYADIWHSIPDSLASIAHYLQQEGWDNTLNWGYEVILPRSLSCTLEGADNRKTFADWQKLGVKRADKQNFLQQEMTKQASLLMPAGQFGPAFLVTTNFYVLKSYNMSDLYAIYIGHVSDGLQGQTSFFTKWQNVDITLRSDSLKIQNILKKQNYDIGKADGLIGFKTRRSIGLWQEKQGLMANCYVTKQLLNALQ